MEQQEIAILLQECADRGRYSGAGDLARHCAYLGGSYSVLAWVDRYCLTRGLYTSEQGAAA